jgi:uncharacterized FlaG/YvyC family protein
MAADIFIHRPAGLEPVSRTAPVADRHNPAHRTARDEALHNENPPTLFPESQLPATSAQVTASVEALNRYLESTSRELRFSIDQASGHAIISVYNAVTHELIRQIPPQEVVALAQWLTGTEFTTIGIDALA